MWLGGQGGEGREGEFRTGRCARKHEPGHDVGKKKRQKSRKICSRPFEG